MPQSSPVVVDTSAFFAGTKKIHEILEKGDKLTTIDLVVFEFTKVMEDEIFRARGSGRTERVKMLEQIRRRFPKLLSELEIDVSSPMFSYDDVADLYLMIASGYDSGDAMIWIKMKNAGLRAILTDNVADWKKLGATVISSD